jgi:hypothetical protein
MARGPVPYSWIDRTGSSSANRAMHRVLWLRSAMPRAVIISLTNSPPGSNVRHSRRNGALVMPAIGASTTGGHTRSGPILSGVGLSVGSTVMACAPTGR